MSDYDWHIYLKREKNKNIAIFYDDPYPFLKDKKKYQILYVRICCDP